MNYRAAIVVPLLALALCHPAAALYPGDSLQDYAAQSWETESGLPQNTVSAILQTRDGYLWFATEGGLVRFDGQRFAVFDSQKGALPADQVRGLSEDANGTLWVSTAGGLAQRIGDRFVQPDHPAPFPRTTTLELTHNTEHWIATTHGLEHSDVSNERRTFTTADGLPSNRVLSLLLDREGLLWIGTDAGLARWRNGKFERFAPNDRLASASTLALYEDREGDLWIGTDANGVTVLRNQRFTAYSSPAMNLDRPVRCVLADRAGALWAGTDGAGLVRLKDGVAAQPAWNHLLASGVILALAQSAAGDLLVGTPDGLNIVHNDQVSLLTAADGLAEDFVRSLYADRDGSTWVGTRRGLTHIEGSPISKTPRTATYTQADGLGSDLVGSLLRDAQGVLWAGTLNGLSRFEHNSFTTFTTKDGLPGSTITDLQLDRSGVLWIATNADVAVRRAQSFARLPNNAQASARLPGAVYGIVEDSAGNTWFTTKTGIFRMHATSIVPFGTGDGLRVRECSAGGHPVIAKAANGDIWFAMARGLALLKATHVRDAAPPPLVVVESVAIDGRVFSPAHIARIDAGQSHVAFQYAGLSFAAPNKVCYRYRLQGFDKDWVDAGTQSVAYYTNLPPARYRFEVMAQNSDGLWSTAASSFSFTMEPHFYQTWWFRGLLLLSAGLLVYLGFYLRVRQVRASYAAVLGERNRIAREIHDTLAQGFVGVSVQLEVVRTLMKSAPEAAARQLDETRLLVRQSITEARQSIWELRAQSTEHQDFAARLANMAKQVASASGARVQMAVHGTFRPLSPALEDELFRIGQEAVTNAVRHGHAHHIDIELAFDSKKLRLTVADDGCGFEGAVNSVGPEGHFGLKGMRERARRIQAELRIDSAVGKGTKVWVETAAKPI